MFHKLKKTEEAKQEERNANNFYRCLAFIAQKNSPLTKIAY
jgi:hypothetical protein